MLESKYRSLLGDKTTVSEVSHRMKVPVAFEYNDNLQPSFDIKGNYLGWVHDIKTSQSELYFDLSDPQNPIVFHENVQYVYDPSDCRRKELGYRKKQSYTVLLDGGKTATAISRSFSLEREGQAH